MSSRDAAVEVFTWNSEVVGSNRAIARRGKA
jgi:hypothetical protein